MPRAVIDVNVLVSSLINPRGTAGQIQRAWRLDKVNVITSDAIITKTEEVLRRPHIFKLFPVLRAEARIQGLLRLMRDQAIRTPNALNLRVIEADPEDDTIIIAAIEGKADCIISGDRHLKNLGTYQNIPILSPAEFVDQYHIL
jgi:putative PIN family toxin of toxin-antitoxin system